MKQSCFRIEELGEIARLDPNDPRLEHLKECAHCRALLASCREFHEPKELPEGLDIEDAERRLAVTFDRAIQGREGGREVVGAWEDASRPQSPRGSSLSCFLRNLWRPALRPAWGVGAAVAIIFLAVHLIDFRDGASDRIVPRIEQDPARLEFILHEPQPLEGGEVRLAWQPVEDADAYRVLFFDADLDELARLDTGSASTVALRPEDVGGLPVSGTKILWQVVALRSGDELTRSHPAGLRLP